MAYKIPFLQAVKFMCSSNLFGHIEHYIRMKIFLLFVITYYINTSNPILTEHPCCGFSPMLHTVRSLQVAHSVGAVLVIFVLALTKSQVEMGAEIVFVLILSIWVNLLPIHFIIKMGHKSATFKELFEAILNTGPEEETLCYELHDEDTRDVNPIIMYGATLFSFALQGVLSDWLLEITVHEVTRTEQVVMQALLAAPVIIAAAIKHQQKTINADLLDWLPYIGLIPSIMPCFSAAMHIQSPPNPLIFAIPLEKFAGINSTMGTFFVIKWFYLQLKLSVKYNFLTYEAMPSLRYYFVARVILNLTKMPATTRFTLDGILETLLCSFQQDYMTVIGSSAWISKWVRYYIKKGIRIASDSKTDVIEKHLLGFIPTSYIILGFINVHFECDKCNRLDNMAQIMKFLMLILLSFTYTASWQEAINNVSFLALHKHAGYMKMFLGLAVCPIILIICFQDEEDPPPCNYTYCTYFGHCKNEIICEEDYEGFELITFIVYQICAMSFLSMLIILSIMLYSWYIMKEEENDENYESRLIGALAAVGMIEAMLAFVVFHKIQTKCTQDHAQRYLLLAMGTLNVYSTVIERGYYIVGKIQSDWKTMAGVLNNMKLLDEEELEDFDEPYCVICDDDVEENGRLSDCGHLFHTFCIREWVAEYGAFCPECNAVLQLATPPLIILLSDDDDEDLGPIDPAVAPEMLMKIVEEMEKFDYKTSYFSELGDMDTKGGDSDYSEYDSDDEDD